MSFSMMPLQAYFAIWWHSCLSAEMALEQASKGELTWNKNLSSRAEPLQKALLKVDKETLKQALRLQMSKEWQSLCEGALVGCKATQQEKPVLDAQVAWQKGSVKLLDYAPESEGQPILVIPSLINRAYILDLHPNRSFLKYLVARGFRPFLVEWSDPDESESGFFPENYVTERLVPALSEVLSRSEKKPAIMGYCVGGVLGLALAQLHMHDISGLMLLATPWDFQTSEQVRIPLKHEDAIILGSLLDKQLIIPADMVQALFYWLHPDLVRQKLKMLASLGKETSVSVSAIEHWVNDGIAMTSKTARTFWLSWMLENQLAAEKWKVAGVSICPSSIRQTLPICAVLPQDDRIVPVASAKSLVKAFGRKNNQENITSILPETGHVGMVVGRKARAQVWEPCVEWLSQLTA